MNLLGVALVTWNDYFETKNDNKPPSVIRKTSGRTFNDFENDYRRMYGKWLDHHLYQLIIAYGSEEASQIIHNNIVKLNEAVKRRQEEEATRYDFKEIPDNVFVPF